MALLPYALARPFLFGLDPERAHDLTLAALAGVQYTPLLQAIARPRVHDPVRLAGLEFPNRIGLAAGLDKNGRCIDGLAAMGFGFIEVGTVTPRPQPGNPKPRVFRLPQARALINRLGFNNEGLAAFVANVRRARFRAGGGVLGLNIGKNASTPIEDAAQDYLAALEGVYPHADYVTVNISSPNTAHLRSLQAEAALDALLAALLERRARLAAVHGSGSGRYPGHGRPAGRGSRRCAQGVGDGGRRARGSRCQECYCARLRERETPSSAHACMPRRGTRSRFPPAQIPPRAGTTREYSPARLPTPGPDAFPAIRTLS